MAAVYELIDLESGNLVGAYGNEDEAYAIVRAPYRAHGRAAVAALALLRVDDDGEQRLLSESDTLVLRALGEGAELDQPRDRRTVA